MSFPRAMALCLAMAACDQTEAVSEHRARPGAQTPAGVAPQPSVASGDLAPAAGTDPQPASPATAAAVPPQAPGAAAEDPMADLRGHPCQCGKTCHCGHCGGAVPGCHCHVKRADGAGE